MSRNPLGALVIAKNEARVLPRCFKSLNWIREIVFVDDYSADESIEIAKKFGAKIFKRKLDDFATQRNFGLSKINSKWVLSVDADEEVTPELKEEIETAIGQEEYAGYYFPRKNIIFGKWIRHAGWHPDYQLHLFQANRGRYTGSVHEEVKLQGKAGYLKNYLLHHNYQTISQYLSKLEQYSSLAAKMKIKSGYCLQVEDIFREPAGEFFKRFFAMKGYQDGFHGLILSLLQAFSILATYAKIWENQGFKVEKEKELLFEVAKEARKTAANWRYWFFSSRLEEEINPLKRILIRIRRRLT